METLQFGTVIGSDFQEGEMFILMENDDFNITFSDVAIVVIETLEQRYKLEQFINNNFK